MANATEILEQAVQYHRSGNWSQAEQLYRQLLASHPNHADAHHLLGVLAIQAECYTDAIDRIRQAIVFSPLIADFHCNLGVALEKIGQRSAAAEAYRQALSIAPEYAEALNNLAVLLTADGKPSEAIMLLRQALGIRPDYADASSNLGDAMKALGNPERAVDYYLQAIRLNPHSVNALNNLGIARMEQGDLEAAMTAYQQAVARKPDFAEAYNNIGNVFLKQENFASARQSYLRAIELSPRYLPAYRNLAMSLRSLGEEELAKKIVLRGLDIDPDDAESLILLVDLCQQTCQWNGLDELCQRVTAHVEKTDCAHSAPLISPFTFMALPTVTTAELQLRCASQWGRAFRTTLPGFHKSRNATASNERPSKLRVGYLSADFRSHVVGYIVPEWFESHDRSRFEVFGYSIGVDDKSSIRQRIVNACNEFRDCHELTFQETARSIAADEIDILVDLQGYTQLSRSQILAYRPAPIQVNYLGYPGTMGVEFIDAILVDDFVVPSSQQPSFTERLVHLPGCYLVTDSQRTKDIPSLTRKLVGLPEGAFVFCAFSTTYKLTARMFDIWLHLLSKIPNSILWLRYDRERMSDELRSIATERGIDAERLVFAPSVSLPEHLARQKLADLFLDTFPYNQHSTASDALRVGLPLLTLSGQTFSSRVAGSLLHALNLQVLITDSFDAYQSTALHLARHPIELQRIRNRLSAELASTEIFSGQVFARHIENAFDEMWRRYLLNGWSGQMKT